MDCNLKRVANLFKRLVQEFEQLLKTDYSLIFRGKIISFFNRRALN